MKYMGSKRMMLENGLGDLIKSQAPQANRIIDPFCGSGAVAWFAAACTDKKVIAADLQSYSVVLARAVLWRTEAFASESRMHHWIELAESWLHSSSYYFEACQLEKRLEDIELQEFVSNARALCANTDCGVIWNAYGGHYFSPLQALKIDALRMSLPTQEPEKSVLLAALISCASACSASPGHTAQPFQPTLGASKFLLSAWQRDPFHYCVRALHEISSRYARVIGDAFIRDATDLASETEERDLLIIDPPYSSVHYSRFYHVLETVARGECGFVEGSGRYPPSQERPRSEFSLKTKSETAMSLLLSTLAARKTTVILTFPADQSSNGLTGERVIEIADGYFQVEKHIVEGRFSTLGGGNSNHRPARKNSRELVLLLR